ncbi:hypothetical protein FKW77_010510 [Venturia effusa]|uniref:Response regulatory domain-containing protein n=1 Tax=Venturia effusa TaxID=50376 RepID=A0A517L0J9_9PEZI|nr:hypothetical protein FKW77_010510 [Venturia effusa]
MQKIAAPLPVSTSQTFDPEARLTACQNTASCPTLVILDPTGALKEVSGSKRPLLAEDNMINQRVILKVLRALGFAKIDTAPFTSSSAPTATLNAARQHYDLILMDISMPNLDGFGATSAIRRHGISTPTIAMTANALRGDREECIEKGMDDYISKPVERGELVRVLSRCLVPGYRSAVSLTGIDSAGESVVGSIRGSMGGSAGGSVGGSIRESELDGNGDEGMKRG